MTKKVHSSPIPSNHMTCNEFSCLLSHKLSAGFPSPAADYTEDSPLDLNAYLIKNKSSTFFFTVDGDSMVDIGIHSGDKVSVDRSVNPKSGNIVVAVLNGGFVIKRLSIDRSRIALKSENKNYREIKISPEDNFQIWGVVTGVIRKINH